MVVASVLGSTGSWGARGAGEEAVQLGERGYDHDFDQHALID